MRKHTPGPWATDGNEKTWSLLDKEGRRIALIDKGGINAPQNARLIMAAPELLQAVKELKAIVRGWSDSSFNGLMPQIEALIKKVEGGE